MRQIICFVILWSPLFICAQQLINSGLVPSFSTAGQGDLYVDQNDVYYIGLEDGSLKEIGIVTERGTTNGDLLSWNSTTQKWEVSTASSVGSWLVTGNSGTNNSNFLGTIDDVRMQIRSNNTPMLEFGRRQTLGLTQSFPDYTDNDQPLVLVNGDGNTSALQFTSSGASFYKPMFFTTTNGSFRLKGSTGGTDLFEIGSAGPNNKGRLEFIIGDDGNEPIVFKRYDWRSGQFHKELFRVQGSNETVNAKTRFGININTQNIPLDTNYDFDYNAGAFNMANSTLQVNGSVSKSILETTGNLTLTEDHHTIVLGGNHNITLPNANTCEGRIYVIKNPSSTNTPSISSYQDLTGSNSTSLDASSTLWLQSDGTNWQQVTNNNVSAGGGSGWNLTGNTVTATDYLGTNNFASLFFRVNSNQIGSFHPLGGIALGRSATANNNQGIAIGENADGGQQATAVGYEAEATGFQSNAFGYGTSATTNSATAIGFNSTASGQQSTVLGYNSTATGQNSTVIGHGASTAQANAVVIGNTTDDTQFAGTKVGLGTSTPTRRLHVDGGFRLVDGTEGDGKILTSDANGNASWEEPAFPQILVDANRTFGYNPDNNGFTTIAYNSTTVNIGNAYNTGNGTFTAPATGVYEVIVHNTYRAGQSNDNMVELQIVANGNVDIRLASAMSPYFQGNNLLSTISGSTVVSLNNGQTIQVQVGNEERTMTPQTGAGQHKLKIIRLK